MTVSLVFGLSIGAVTYLHWEHMHSPAAVSVQICFSKWRTVFIHVRVMCVWELARTCTRVCVYVCGCVCLRE